MRHVSKRIFLRTYLETVYESVRLCVCICASVCFSQSAASQIKRMRAATRGREREKRERKWVRDLNTKYDVNGKLYTSVRSLALFLSLPVCFYSFPSSASFSVFFSYFCEYNTVLFFISFWFYLRCALFIREQPNTLQCRLFNSPLIGQTNTWTDVQQHALSVKSLWQYRISFWPCSEILFYWFVSEIK